MSVDQNKDIRKTGSLSITQKKDEQKLYAYIYIYNILNVTEGFPLREKNTYAYL